MGSGGKLRAAVAAAAFSPDDDDGFLFFADRDSRGRHSRSDFFRGARFRVVPSKVEVDLGILIPGHRFVPFIRRGIFPAELILRPANDPRGRPFSTKVVELPLADIAPSHAYLGIGGMRDQLVADHPVNKPVLATCAISGGVKATVYDLGKYYRQMEFKLGEELEFTVLDWLAGELRIDGKAPAATDKFTEWLGDFERSLGEVIDEHGLYCDMPEQIALACFLGGEDKLRGPAVFSLDGYRNARRSLIVVMAGGDSFFQRPENWANNDGVVAGDMDRDEALTEETVADVADLPVSLSEGSLDSMDSILAELRVPLTCVGVEAIMRDELANGGMCLDNIFHRCFGEWGLEFIDDAQEAVFTNEFEEMWEVVSESYNRQVDADVVPIRAALLELLEFRLEWLRPPEGEPAPELEPGPELEKLMEIDTRLNQMLGILNRGRHQFSDGETNKLLATIEKLGAQQRRLATKLAAKNH